MQVHFGKSGWNGGLQLSLSLSQVGLKEWWNCRAVSQWTLEFVVYTLCALGSTCIATHTFLPIQLML